MSRKRNPNFSEIEIQTLLDEVEKRKDLLFSKHSNVSTNSAKKKAWDTICAKINSVNSGHQRTVDEIRKKWTTYMSATKKKVSTNRREARKTGGGPPAEDITPMEDKVVGIIGDTIIEGLDGGTDTAAEDNPMDFSLQAQESASTYESPCLVYETQSLQATACQINSSPPTTRKTKESDDVNTERLIEIETQRLEIEKELLKTEQQRLQVEKERLEIERQRLNIEQQKHQLYMAQIGVNFTQMGIQVHDTQDTDIQ